MIIACSMNWSYFCDYIQRICVYDIDSDSCSVEKIRRARRIKKIVLVILFLSYACLPFRLCHKKLFFKGQCFLVNSFNVIATIGNFFLLNLIVDSCICLEVAFSSINVRIKDFPRNEALEILLQQMKKIRLNYSHLIRATQSIEKFGRYYITLLYIQMGVFGVLNNVRAFGNTKIVDPTWIICTVADVIYLVYFTNRFVSLNQLSNHGLEDLYEISLGATSRRFQYQVCLLIIPSIK